MFYIVSNIISAYRNLFNDIAPKMARYRGRAIQFDRMDSAGLLFCMSAVREFMLDDQKKYKSALWISGVLPFVIFSCAMFISEPTFSNVVGRAAYVAVILFAIIFSFYRVKVSKVKVWRGVLEAILIIPLYLLLSLLFFLILFWTIGFGDLSGVQ